MNIMSAPALSAIMEFPPDHVLPGDLAVHRSALVPGRQACCIMTAGDSLTGPV